MGLEREGFPPQSLRQDRKTSKLTCSLEEAEVDSVRIISLEVLGPDST